MPFSKIDLLLCMILLSPNVSGFSCPPDDKSLSQYVNGGCVSTDNKTVSYPGGSSQNGNFKCGNKYWNIPSCCLDQVSKSQGLKKPISVDRCKIGSASKREQLNSAESRVKQNQS
ncbi:hypothetical protein PCASD_11134 [Puccinia coronata f. sp. avenae]|uniref:CBM1 domain-containing protein n=1 Tax=Puccinia coronata f. sp. avenae TaxID=200324 RepID=A0A2N5TA75_9BASI|nr:hypothetical protein PCASD_13458 [Puccinia coronata f. sp. avenae]PLW37185.1 hypothetical protein PCASD_11134 [Puccinia coronata f. sp. avenae]